MIWPPAASPGSCCSISSLLHFFSFKCISSSLHFHSLLWQCGWYGLSSFLFLSLFSFSLLPPLSIHLQPHPTPSTCPLPPSTPTPRHTCATTLCMSIVRLALD